MATLQRFLLFSLSCQFVLAIQTIQGETSSSKVSFRDNFQKDSRKQYQIDGKVNWQPGTLQLSEQSAVGYILSARSPAQASFQLQFPSANKEPTCLTELLMFKSGSHAIRVIFQRKNNKNIISIIESKLVDKKSQIRILAEKSLGNEFSSGIWNVEYQYGLIRVSHKNEVFLKAYIEDSLGTIAGIGCNQGTGSVRLAQLTFNGNQPLRQFTQKELATLTQAAKLGEQAAQLGDEGKHQEAIKMNQKVYDLRLSLLGKDHPLVVDAVGSIGRAMAKAHHPEALKFMDKVMERSKAVYGADHPTTAFLRTTFGNAQVRNFDYSGALSSFEEAAKVFETLKVWKQAARLRVRMANLQSSLNKLKEAKRLFTIALKQVGKLEGEIALQIQVYRGLGRILTRNREWEKASDYYQKAAKLLQQTAPNSLEMAELLREQSVLYYQKKEPKKGLQFIDQALALLKNVKGTPSLISAEYRQVGHIYNQLAENATTARVCFEKALTLVENEFGEYSSDVVNCVSLLGSLHLQNSNYKLAIPQFQRAFDIRVTLARNVIPGLSETGAMQYLKSGTMDGDVLLYTLRQGKVDPAIAYRVVWEMKSRATRFMSLRQQLTFDDPKAMQLQKQLQDKRAQLAQLWRIKVPAAKREAHQSILKKLTEEKEKLERSLAAVSTQAARRFAQSKMDFSQLGRNLDKDTAIVDFMQLFRNTSATYYDAFILKKSPKAPGYTLTWLKFDKADELNQLAKKWYQAVSGKNNRLAEINKLGLQLREKLWEPIEAHLGNCNTVVILPTDDLSQLTWAALPGKEKQYLIEERAICVAGYGQQLQDILTRKPSMGDELLVVSDVSYGSLNDKDKLTKPTKDDTWQELPGTEIEGERILELWGKPKKATHLNNEHATETTVRKAMQHARFIHFATHGIFGDENDQSISPTQSDVRNPLLFSRLMLTGANRKSNPGKEDGVLLAEELAGINLEETELIVLSACDTGLGVIAEGEGMLGLQRAFALGGARTVIASHWRVNDAATSLLMEEFYNNLWKKKLSKLEALRQAQLTLLKNPDRLTAFAKKMRGKLGNRAPGVKEINLPNGGRIRKRNHPALWAGFVLSGDFRK